MCALLYFIVTAGIAVFLDGEDISQIGSAERNVGQSVSTTIRWIHKKLCADIHVPPPEDEAC